MTSINREGTWGGLDLDEARSVSQVVDVPLIVHGGLSVADDVSSVSTIAGVTGVGVGSRFVYIARNRGVLINYFLG